MEKGIASEQGEIIQPRSVHILKGFYRRPETDREISDLLALSDKALERRLKNCLDTEAQIKGESLIYLARCFAGLGHEKLFNLVFSVLNKQFAGTLMNHVWRWSKEEQKEHAADILAQIIQTLRTNPRGLDYAEVNFNHYLKLRSVDLYRKKRRTIEKDRFQENPHHKDDDGGDAGEASVENIADSRPSPEKYAMAVAGLRNLPEDIRKVLLLYHFRDMEQKEIAKIMQVSEKTIRNWLKEAQELLNIGGEVK